MGMSILPLMLSLVLLARAPADIDPTLPKEVDVLPVFFVAKGESLPTQQQKSLLMKHLKMSQVIPVLKREPISIVWREPPRTSHSLS
jgi:hypothetical protein